MPLLRSFDVRWALFASAMGCALPWNAAQSAPSHAVLVAQLPDDPHDHVISVDGKLTPDGVTFPALAGVKQFAWDEIYFNSSTCEDLGPGTFTTTIAPHQGTLTFAVQKREIHDGECAGKSFKAIDAFYTWTASGGTSDSFEIQFNPPDGSTPTKFDLTAQRAVTSTSWYTVAGSLHGLDLNAWMLQQGGVAGGAALAGGTGYGFIVLDFGNPTVNGTDYGATAYTKKGLTTDQIQNAVVKFAEGYARASRGASAVTLIVGTNNSYSSAFTLATIKAHGRAWGQMVQSLIAKTARYAGVSVVGGIDAEVAFTPYGPGNAEAWVDNFSSTGGLVVDFGDAQGCPQSGSTASPGGCDHGWTQADIRHVSWSSTALPLPEIYATGGGTAREWQQEALYIDLSTGGSQMLIAGPLTQFGACQTNHCTAGTNNTPQQAWDQLWNDLDKDTHTTLYPSFRGVSTDISWRH